MTTQKVEISVVGARIRQARELKGMTQSDLAKAIHTDTSLVSKWERSEVAPRGSTLGKIAEHLGTTIEWLKTGVDTSDFDPIEDARIKEVSYRSVADSQRDKLVSLMLGKENRNQKEINKTAEILEIAERFADSAAEQIKTLEWAKTQWDYDEIKKLGPIWLESLKKERTENKSNIEVEINLASSSASRRVSLKLLHDAITSLNKRLSTLSDDQIASIAVTLRDSINNIQ